MSTHQPARSAFVMVALFVGACSRVVNPSYPADAPPEDVPSMDTPTDIAPDRTTIEVASRDVATVDRVTPDRGFPREVVVDCPPTCMTEMDCYACPLPEGPGGGRFCCIVGLCLFMTSACMNIGPDLPVEREAGTPDAVTPIDWPSPTDTLPADSAPVADGPPDIDATPAVDAGADDASMDAAD